MLLHEFLEPMGLTQSDVAERIGVPYQRINELVNGRRGVTPSTALRLARLFGTTPDLWLNLQLRWDLFHAEREESAELGRIKKLRGSGRAA
jgi:addiction module HigA family antidote